MGGGGKGVECALGLDGQGREKRMTGGDQMSVGKMEANLLSLLEWRSIFG